MSPYQQVVEIFRAKTALTLPLGWQYFHENQNTIGIQNDRWQIYATPGYECPEDVIRVDCLEDSAGYTDGIIPTTLPVPGLTGERWCDIMVTIARHLDSQAGETVEAFPWP